MKESNLDTLILYADLEHGNTFEYITDFLPLFIESLLVLHKNETQYRIMGNENLNKVTFSRIPATAIHAPHFSLPNQPMDNRDTIHTIKHLRYKFHKMSQIT